MRTAQGGTLDTEGTKVDRAIAMAVNNIQPIIKGYTAYTKTTNPTTKPSFFKILNQKFKDFISFLKETWSKIKRAFRRRTCEEKPATASHLNPMQSHDPDTPKNVGFADNVEQRFNRSTRQPSKRTRTAKTSSHENWKIKCTNKLNKLNKRLSKKNTQQENREEKNDPDQEPDIDRIALHLLNDDGYTPLMVAVITEDLKTIQWILAQEPL